MPFGSAIYGTSILGFTNVNPSVVTVSSAQYFQAGQSVRIANLVTSTGSQIVNNDYTVQSVGTNTVTLDLDGTSVGDYVSGGFLSILENVNNSNTPYLQSNLTMPLTPWVVFNQALGSQIQTVEFISENPVTGSNFFG